VVTGASKGIGAGIAKALAAEGAAVVVNYASSKEDAEKVVAHIAQAGGKAVAARGDVSTPDDAHGIINTAIKNFGRLNIVVNNSGVYEFAAIEATTEALFHKMFKVKQLGEGASIINIGSAATTIFPPNSAIYSGSKGAVDAITGVLANELGARKIRVNAINPGFVETEGTHSGGFVGSDFVKDAVAQTPLGRTGQPADIARVAVFLASDDSAWLTGEHYVVSGGLR
jgi:3-oxoacyl-[acyl-carrier protein] reductase